MHGGWCQCERESARRGGIALVTPAPVLAVGLFFVPLGLMIWMSFNQWPLLGSHSFVGLANYGDRCTTVPSATACSSAWSSPALSDWACSSSEAVWRRWWRRTDMGLAFSALPISCLW